MQPQPSLENPNVQHRMFSPLLVRHSIQEPLRYLFSKVPPDDLKYDSDPAKTKLVIGTKGDRNMGTPVQQKPRILLSVGGYRVSGSGLTENMTSALPVTVTKGTRESKHMTMVQGSSTLLIEAPEEGVVLTLVDMTTHFLTWCSPHICNTFGFKLFASTLNVTYAEMESEDVEKYQATIRVPWMHESHWKIKEDALQIKEIFFNIETV